jgi:apolipoprotein N-acyltransferase
MTTTSPKSPAVLTAALMLGLAPAAALVFLWPTATAQTPAKTAYVQVAIETDVDQDAEARIKAAAANVCEEVSIHSPLNPREQSDCQRETAAKAMTQLIAKRQGIAIASAD